MELEQGVRAMNPADWIVDIAAGLIQPTPLQADGSLTVRGLMRGLALTVELGAVWRESVAANKGAAVGNGLETEDAAAKKMEAGAQEDEGLQAQTSSLPVQLWIQTRRGLVTRFRDHRKLALFTLLHIGMAVALSVGFSIYIQGSYRSTLSPPLSNTLKAYCPSIVRGLCERNNGDLAFQQLLFFISFAVGSITAQAAIGLFGMEGSGPAQIRRECGDSGLSPLMFGVGRMLADLPIIAWNTSLFAAVWMLMGHVGKWYYWLAIVLATGFAASGLGYVASLLTRPANAAVVVMIATITQSVFSGVEPQLRLVDPLPVVNWAWYTSYAAYVAEATYVTWTEHMVDTESGHGSVQQGADYYGFEVRQGIGRPIAALFALGLMWRAVALYILWRTARPQQSVSALQWALALLKCK